MSREQWFSGQPLEFDSWDESLRPLFADAVGQLRVWRRGPTEIEAGGLGPYIVEEGGATTVVDAMVAWVKESAVRAEEIRCVPGSRYSSRLFVALARPDEVAVCPLLIANRGDESERFGLAEGIIVRPRLRTYRFYGTDRVGFAAWKAQEVAWAEGRDCDSEPLPPTWFESRGTPGRTYYVPADS